jgi:hypothetical protein
MTYVMLNSRKAEKYSVISKISVQLLVGFLEVSLNEFRGNWIRKCFLWLEGFRMILDDSGWSRIIQNVSKWSKIVQNVSKCFKMIQNDPE